MAHSVSRSNNQHRVETVVPWCPEPLFLSIWSEERWVGRLCNKVNRLRLFTSLRRWRGNRTGLRDTARLHAPQGSALLCLSNYAKKVDKIETRLAAEHAWLYNTIQWRGKMEDNSARIIATDSQRSSISTMDHQITFRGIIFCQGHFKVVVMGV